MTQMGWLWSDVNPFLSQEEKDRETGIYVMKGYFAIASPYARFPYPNITLDDYIQIVDSENPDFFRSLGEVIRLNDSMWVDEDDAVNKIEQLARNTEGRATLAQIRQWSVDPSKDVSWYSPAIEPVTDILENVGEGIVTTSKIIRYLPYIALGLGVAYLAYQTYRQGELVNKVSKLL